MSRWESNTKIDRKGIRHGGGDVNWINLALVKSGKEFVKMVKKLTQGFNVYCYTSICTCKININITPTYFGVNTASSGTLQLC
jgi:hypothetical protein